MRIGKWKFVGENESVVNWNLRTYGNLYRLYVRKLWLEKLQLDERWELVATINGETRFQRNYVTNKQGAKRLAAQWMRDHPYGSIR